MAIRTSRDIPMVRNKIPACDHREHQPKRYTRHEVTAARAVRTSNDGKKIFYLAIDARLHCPYISPMLEMTRWPRFLPPVCGC